MKSMNISIADIELEGPGGKKGDDKKFRLSSVSPKKSSFKVDSIVSANLVNQMNFNEKFDLTSKPVRTIDSDKNISNKTVELKTNQNIKKEDLNILHSKLEILTI